MLHAAGIAITCHTPHADASLISGHVATLADFAIDAICHMHMIMPQMPLTSLTLHAAAAMSHRQHCHYADAIATCQHAAMRST
jgi:hypothetical protein